MKKIITVCGFVLMASVVTPGFATTMCAADDTLAIVLDPTQNSTNYTYNSGLFEWRDDFTYGSLHGIAACLERSGSYAVAVDDLTDMNGKPVIGGEHTGKYCWCKMTHPVVSRWVYRNAHSSASECGSLCAYNCAYYVRNNSAFRGGVFGSLGN